MINRYYFMSVKKIHDDGNGSYSFNHFTFSRKSLFPEPLKAYEGAFEDAKKAMAEKPGTVYEVTAFNRI